MFCNRTCVQAAAAQAELRSRDLGSSQSDAELAEARRTAAAAAARAEEAQALAAAAEAESERLREAYEAEAAELATLRQHLESVKAAQREAAEAARAAAGKLAEEQGRARDAAAEAAAARAEAAAAKAEAAAAAARALGATEQLQAAAAAAAVASTGGGAAEHGTVAVLTQRVHEYAAACAALEQRLADEQQRFASAEEMWAQRLQSMATPVRGTCLLSSYRKDRHVWRCSNHRNCTELPFATLMSCAQSKLSTSDGISNKKEEDARPGGDTRVSMLAFDVEAAALSGPVSDGADGGKFTTLAGRIRGLAATAPKPLGPLFSHPSVLAAASQLDRVSLALGKMPLVRLLLIVYVALLQLLCVLH